MVKLTNDDIKSISLFEQMTGAAVKDCVIDGDTIVFIVKEGDFGRAIGKGGSAIARVRRMFNKHVEVFEHAETPEAFIRHLFSTVQITNVNIQGEGDDRVAFINVDPKDRGVTIGRDGARVKLARMLLKRHFNIDLKLH